jgi:hypothetical protein
MILTLTNKDKIFGAYTPLSFVKHVGKWGKDERRESFLFSVS